MGATGATRGRRRPRASPFLLAVAALAAAAGCERSPSGAGDDAAAVARVVAGITPDAVGGHVAYLAGDALRGRLTPSPGLAAAADYIAGVFRAAGLAPGGDGGSFLQPYPCAGVAASSWPANVVGLLPGSDRARTDEWVVLSAHYDHLGVGTPDARGDSIYNGADDNASGTAALLEAARAFAALPRRPARSIVFVAVSGEEQGLVGAAWFVAHRPAAIAELVADVNLDMVGRNSPELIFLVGDTLSTLGPVAAAQSAAHPELGFQPRSGSAADQVFFHSDQYAFATAGVPGLMLHTGTHTDLHRPSDEAQTLDIDKVARAARLAFYLTYAVASAPQPPAWTPAGERMHFQPYPASCAAPGLR